MFSSAQEHYQACPQLKLITVTEMKEPHHLIFLIQKSAVGLFNKK